MNRPLFVVALRQAARIRRQDQELVDLSRSFQQAIRVNHRMADNLAAANRERDEARADAELIFSMLPPCERSVAVDLVRWRREVETEEAS